MNWIRIIILVFCSFVELQLNGQELEPRSINNIPVGANFIIGGYGYARGNILLDAALPIEGLDSRIHTGVVAYVRSLRFFGMSSKLDVVLPYATGDYEADLDEGKAFVERSGFGDLRLRFSFNFVGSKAMNMEQFQDYAPKVVSGISIQLIAPTGYYDSEFLINPGSNRWVVKPQWGIARNYEKWNLEAYVGLWLFGRNDDFLGGNVLEQEPLVTFKGHAIRTLKNKSWFSFSAGYAIGGKTELNGVSRETQISTMRLAFLYALPISKKSTLKFTAISGIRFQRGSDYNGLGISYQYRWLK